jgi:LysM repeat protein
VTVAPGDSLWSIAGDVAPDADRRDTVAEIMELNALSGSSVNVGQRIAVPLSR